MLYKNSMTLSSGYLYKLQALKIGTHLADSFGSRVTPEQKFASVFEHHERQLLS